MSKQAEEEWDKKMHDRKLKIITTFLANLNEEDLKFVIEEAKKRRNHSS